MIRALVSVFLLSRVVLSVVDKSESSQPVRTGTVVKFAGAVVATLIGSGFASGQEVLQFFTAYGKLGTFGAIIAIVLFAAVGAIFLHYGFKHKNSDDFSSFRYFAGKYLGTFLEWFTILFCFLVGIIMISGAGATLNQYFGVPQLVGSGIMALLMWVSALFGARRIVDILGSIGPVTIIFLIFLSTYALITHADGLANAEAAMAAAESIPYGVGNSSMWFAIGGIMYVAYNLLAGVPFMSEMGTEAKSGKEAILGGALGGALLGICALVLHLAMLATYGETAHYEVPILQIAVSLSPVVGFLFVIILLAEIYNTTVPMLWTVANAFVSEKKDLRKYRFLISFLSILMLIGGQLPFGTLVGVIYPFVGYFGIAFMVIVFVQLIRYKLSGDKPTQPEAL